jgi:hypothetical protein
MDSTSFELICRVVIFTSDVRPIKQLVSIVLLRLCNTSVLGHVFARLDVFWGYHQRLSPHHQLCFSVRLKRSYHQYIIGARQLRTLKLLE